MRHCHKLALLICACALTAWAQNKPKSEGAPARIIVTTGHFYSHSAPLLTVKDLTLVDASRPLPITAVTPLRGDHGALDLYLLVDNCSNCEAGTQFSDLRKFIKSQPPSTRVGVAYIQEGKLRIALPPTVDRESAIEALNTPTGNRPTTPFRALAELIRGWKDSSARHAVLMISNGVDPEPHQDSDFPSAETAIVEAQRAGVTVYAIYHPSADYATASFEKIYTGQVQLAHVTVETGGEAYFLGFGPLPSLVALLSDIGDHLDHQYLVEFLAHPGEASELREITVRSTLEDTDLMAPNKVFVPARASGR